MYAREEFVSLLSLANARDVASFCGSYFIHASDFRPGRRKLATNFKKAQQRSTLQLQYRRIVLLSFRRSSVNPSACSEHTAPVCGFRLREAYSLRNKKPQRPGHSDYTRRRLANTRRCCAMQAHDHPEAARVYITQTKHAFLHPAQKFAHEIKKATQAHLRQTPSLSELSAKSWAGSGHDSVSDDRCIYKRT